MLFSLILSSDVYMISMYIISTASLLHVIANKHLSNGDSEKLHLNIYLSLNLELSSQLSDGPVCCSSYE